jgi:hypothetical protein
MSSHEHDALIRKLDDLDRQIEAKRRDFEARGQFSQQHQAFVAKLKERQAAIRRRVGAQMKDGVSWPLIKTEFERDFDGLHGELLRWEERLDAATLAKKSP